MASGKPLNAEQRGAILRMALAGRSKAEVAKRLGISYWTVRLHWPEETKVARKDTKVTKHL